MALQSELHGDGQRIILLPALTIGANVSGTTTPVRVLSGMKYVAVQAKFLYGAGGGTVDAYVQTSLDGGATWIDVMNFRFTTAAATKVSAVSAYIALAAGITPGDAALASNTILNGLLGDRIRVSYVTASTAYSGATSLALDAIVKG